jgi:hypothetical protein
MSFPHIPEVASGRSVQAVAFERAISLIADRVPVGQSVCMQDRVLESILAGVAAGVEDPDVLALAAAQSIAAKLTQR